MWLFASKDSDGLLGSAASLGLNFTHGPVSGFSIDPPNAEPLGTIHGPYGLTWRLFPGLKKKTKEEVTLFVCNLTSNAVSVEAGDLLPIFQSTVKWMKTLRHPNMLTWIGGSEIGSGKLPSEFGFVTERVLPLREYLRIKADCGNFNLLSSWGIHQVAKALVFLNDDGKLAHNAVRLDSVFVTAAGEWKLGALDFVGPVNQPPPSARQTAGFVNANGIDPYTPADNCLVDSWGLGCLIWEIFNPSSTLKDRTQLTESSFLRKIPKELAPDYRRLVAQSATKGGVKRFTVSQFLQSARSSEKHGFLANDYVDTLLFLEEIELKDGMEKSTFLKNLAAQVTSFPDDVCRHKILPHLVNGLRYGSAGIEALLPVLRLIPLLSESDFQAYVLPCLLKLFSSPERATRVRLLEHLPDFVQHLQIKCVETQIYGPVSAGFTDTHPIVREATVRAMIHLAPKLPNKLLNENLIKHITTLQARDGQGGIRTNSTVCLAKLASYFSTQVQQGPMLSAFLRATRDPFLPNRQAAITSLAATQEYYTNDLLAGKVLPCLSFLTTDAEKSIRDDTFRAIRGILDRLEHASEHCVISQTCDKQTSDNTKDSSRIGITGTASASALTQWALSALSFSSRLLPSTISTTDDKSKPSDTNIQSTPDSSSLTPHISKNSAGLEKIEETLCSKDILENSSKFTRLSSPNSSVPKSSLNDNNESNSWNLIDNNDIDEVDGDDWNLDISDTLKDSYSNKSTSNRNSQPTVSSYWDYQPATNQEIRANTTSLNLDWNSNEFFDSLTLQEENTVGKKTSTKISHTKLSQSSNMIEKRQSNRQQREMSPKRLLNQTSSSMTGNSSNKLVKSSTKELQKHSNKSTVVETDDWGDW
ncbi:N-terminal kinase-like protein [Schistosoma japonicum]|nr:N-terminal kinase-like protein [Schistosoma japonicum]KAH8855544.1 N-terminal kinase-like protein [Schistosoma japonicum]